jgi:hypothetical protein
MGIVERLNKIGIKQGRPADILLDSSEQVKLIHDYHIDTKTNRFTKYRCLIASNSGRRKYRTPVLGHDRESKLPPLSLQLGIFSLIYFEHVLALDPTERRKPKGSFELKLFKIPEDRFDLKDLVSRYNLRKVYINFLALEDKYKRNRAKFIAAYESMTYQDFLKREEVGKKALLNASSYTDNLNEPKMEVIEGADDLSAYELKTLMASSSYDYETENSSSKDKLKLDPWKNSSDT